MENKGTHFVLVPGSCHGAWCWYKMVAQLKSKGHKVTALELAASGIDPKQVHQVHLFSDYVVPLMDFMLSLPPEERVILVGHSMGGLCISLAMEKFPEKISAAVFTTAVMPGPDLCLSSINEEELVLALSLLRPVSVSTATVLSSKEEVNKEKYGSVRRVYIVCNQDIVIKPSLQEWMIQNNPTDEVKVINGPVHMVMFSKPFDFCSCLPEIAE